MDWILRGATLLMFQLDSLLDLFGYGIIISLALILIAFFYQGRKRQRNAPHLTIAILLGLIGQGLAATGIASLYIGITLVVWSFFFIYLHYSALEYLRPNILIFSLLLIINSMIIAFSTTSLFYIITESSLRRLMYSTIRLLTSVSCLIALGKVLPITYKINKLSPTKASMLEIVGLVFLAGYRVVFFGRDIAYSLLMIELANPTHTLLTMIGFVFVAIGLVIILLNYTIHSDYIYSLPFPVHSIMIYNKGGLPSYNRMVHASLYHKESHNFLISGAFTAISQLIFETLGSGTRLRHINAGDHQIFFVNLREDQGTLAVIAMGGTVFFRRSLDRFVSRIPLQLQRDINNADFHPPSVQAKFDEVLMKSFPYLKIHSES